MFQRARETESARTNNQKGQAMEILSYKSEANKRESFYDGYFVYSVDEANHYDPNAYFENYDNAEEYARFMCEKHHKPFGVVGYANHVEFTHLCGYREIYTEEDTLTVFVY